MDKRPFRFRHVHKISVAFLLVAIAILLASVAYTKFVQGWFEPVTHYRIVLRKEGTSGLQVGSDVRVLGKKVGTIERVELCLADGVTKVKPTDVVSPEKIKLVAVVGVSGEYTRFIGAESKALLKRDLGGLGASYLDISRADTAREEAGGFLVYDVEKGMQDEASRVIGLVENKLIPLLDSVKTTSDSANELLTSLSDEGGNLQTTIAELRSTIEKANEGDGSVAMLLNDSGFRDGLKGVLVELQQSSENLNATLAKVEGETLGSVSSALDGVPKMMETMDETMTGVQELTDEFVLTAEDISKLSHEFEVLAIALQRLPLVRNYVDDPEDGDTAEAGARSPGDSRGVGRKLPVARRNR